MTAAPNATRMAASALANDRAHLAREAQDIAEAAARIAQNIDRALACGDFAQLAAQVHTMTLRAERTAVRTCGPYIIDSLNIRATTREEAMDHHREALYAARTETPA